MKPRLTSLFLVVLGCHGGMVPAPPSPDDAVAVAEALEETLPLETGPDTAEVAWPEAGPEAEVPAADVETMHQLKLTGVVPGSGAAAGMETVSLLGDGFQPGMTVIFDQTPSPSVVVVSQTAASVQTPPHPPGVVDVTVVSPDGASATLPDGFSYANPTRLYAVAPDHVPTSGGVPVIITGSGFGPGLKVLVGGSLCPLVKVLDDATASAVVPPGQPGHADVHISTGSSQAVLKDGLFYYEPPVVDLVVPGAGPVAGGTVVSVSGAGFYEGTTVMFGDVAVAGVTVNDLHHLTVVSPPGKAPLAVDLLLKTPYGQATLPKGFLYVQAPMPGVSVLAVSPAHGPASGGNKVAVVAMGLSDGLGTVVRFGGKEAKLLSVSPETFTAVVEAPSGSPGKVAVSVQSEHGSGTLPDAYEYEADLAVKSVTPGSGPVSGGTAVTLTGTGFTKGAAVRFGGLPATSVKVVSATTLTAQTPPGSPGPCTVTVVQGGHSASLANGFVYEAEPGLYAVDPDQGSTSGGTLVRLFGSGFVEGMEVRFGSNPASHVVVETPTRASCRTPAGAMGTVDVTVSLPGGDVLVLPKSFTYFDPTALYGGTWGSQVDGTLNVAVLDSGNGAPIPDAYVIVWTDPKTTYQGYTGPDGVVSFSGPDLNGSQMVSASKDCYDAASVVAFDASNVTLYLTYVCAQGGGMPPGMPTSLITGKVIGLDKYVIPPPGNCWLLKTAPDGVGCLPCWGDDSMCGLGNKCMQIADYGQFCVKACKVQADCPEGYGCMGAPGGFVGCMPLPGKKLAKCRTTTPDAMFENQQPMPWAMADGDSHYEAVAIPGTVAVVCLGGIEDASYSPPQFQPYAMGVKRHVSSAPGQTVEGVNVLLNVPMDRRFRVYLDDPPRDDINGPDANALLIYYDFASDGVIGQDWDLPWSFNSPEIVVEHAPRAFTGDLYDVTYTFMAGAFTLDLAAAQLSTPYSISLRKGVSELDDDLMFRLDGSTWSVVRTGVRKDIYGLWGASSKAMFAVGQDGLVWFFDGFGFTQQMPAGGGVLRGIHGAKPSDAWAVGDGGRVLHFDGVAFSEQKVAALSNLPLRAVNCAATDDCFIVGQGVIAHFDGKTWGVMQDVPFADWQAVVALSGGSAIAVGGGGRVVRVGPTGATLEGSGVGYTLRAVTKTPAGQLFAAGDNGTLIKSDGDGKWAMIPTGTQKALYAVVATGDRVFAFGDTGTIVKFEGGVAVASRIEGFGPHLRAAYADPNGGEGGGATILAMGISQLLIGPFLPVPRAVHPTKGGQMKSLSIDFKADPGIPASLHYLNIAIPSLFGDIQVWTMFVAGDVFHVDLPDLTALEGLTGVPQGAPLKLTIIRLYKPGVHIDHFDYSDLNLLEATTWSADVVNFTRP